MKNRFLRRNCVRNESGSTIIEFSLLLPLFLAFVLGIIDICSYFFVAGQLQYAVEQAARAIRVGKDPVTLKNGSTTVSVIGKSTTQANGFRALVCDNISTFMFGTCTTQLQVDVRSFTSFDIITIPPNQDTNNNGIIDSSEVQYCAGEPGNAVIARAFFNFSTIVPGLSAVFTAVIPGTITIQSATTFRAEPYESSGVTCP